MRRFARVTAVDHIGAHVLRLSFSDGLVRELDFAGCLRGAFAPLSDVDRFGRAALDPVAGTVCWPDGLDLDPDVLHGDERPSSGPAPRLVREYTLRSSA
jgi:hypothetical protein